MYQPISFNSTQRHQLARLLLPGLFLAVLGIGNLCVGLYKESQYRQVIYGLASNSTISGLYKAPPFARIQLIEEKANRGYERRKKALARIDFYRLVIFGGKVFLALSVPFLTLGAGVMLRERKTGYRKPALQESRP